MSNDARATRKSTRINKRKPLEYFIDFDLENSTANGQQSIKGASGSNELESKANDSTYII